MRWESALYGFKEAPGSIDPIVFKYPARSMSAFILTAAFVLLAAAWYLYHLSPALVVVLVPILLLGGVVAIGTAAWNLLAVRRIEVHRSAKKIVEILRTPLRRHPDRVHDFSKIRKISVTRDVQSETGSVSDVIVIELANGEHVDFGNHSGDKGSLLAARLHELTGASVESTS